MSTPSENNETKRRPFTAEELRALLSHPEFIKRKFSNSYAFWLIPLATYTGARLGELCQLDLKDFVEVESIPCIDINDIATEGAEAEEEVAAPEGGGKKLKTRNAKRLIPIHPELIRIGILRHVERLRQQGEQRLFPELSRTNRDGPGAAASKWFARFRDKAGVSTKQETVFHSFRHLFISTILDGGTISPHMLAPIVGHEAELITGKVYWNKKDATKRLPAVEAFTLPDDITAMFPTVEEVTFSPRRGPKPATKTPSKPTATRKPHKAL